MEDKTNEQVATFFNGVTDAMGNHALHICAMYGSCRSSVPFLSYVTVQLGRMNIILTSTSPSPDDTMDALLDIQGFECDPLTRIDRDTPLHSAVRYINENADSDELGLAMVKMMCEAGCDPRVKNKHGLRPADVVLPQHERVKSTLQRTAYMLQEGIFTAEDAGAESDGPSDSD